MPSSLLIVSTPAAGRQREFEHEFRQLADAGKLAAPACFIAGVDGCRAGWVCFKVELPSLATSVEVVDLAALLCKRPANLASIAIDIPIGLLNGPRACDIAARKLLGWPRRNSVFPAPCRAALQASSYKEACAINCGVMGKRLSQQAWGIAPKIKQADDAITPECQQWAFEVHPEVCFWALNGQRPMRHKKDGDEGTAERLAVLRPIFPEIQRHLDTRPPKVGADDLLDAAAAAWTALRRIKGEATCVCTPERDGRGLETAIWY